MSSEEIENILQGVQVGDVKDFDAHILRAAFANVTARAEGAEAALAAARAEGVAAERAAVVACLHGGADAHSGFGRWVVAVALRDHAAHIEAGRHVRPVEGA